ncbi:MAG: hypothetical protein LC106_10540 [Burkholderiales bacterium]|nr:hypothetical protein [Burkholderiales bacterium]
MSQEEINILTVFRRLSNALDSLSADELKRLSDPQYSVEIRAIRRRSKDETTSISTDTNVEDVIKEITALGSRQDAQALLDSRYSTRKSLEPIARGLEIPIAKQDKVEVLRDKIIEATVGARIRSQAIQGTGT